jgi:hypothetical protein
MRPLYITACTPAYKASADELAATLRAHDLPHEVYAIPDLGDWCANCSQKPQAVLRAMRHNAGRPIVWVDADARVCRMPLMFEVMPPVVDLACHYLRGHELLSGTLYFGATDAARCLVEEWHMRCKCEPGVWDQKILQTLIQQTPGLIKHDLPESYVYIFDRGTLAEDEIIIRHLQHSRQHR